MGKPMTEAQRAALARGRAKRQANIRGRRAGHARQAASAQDQALRADAQQPDAGAGQAAGASAPSLNASGQPSSATKGTSKLTPAEQDALLFSFAMGDEDEGDGDEADGGAESKPGLGDRLSGLLLNEAPKAKLGGVTDQEEADAQQAAAQWTDLVSVALIFIAGLVVSQDLAPSEKQARAMAAPLCRIIMRHSGPLRTASADVYDIAAFGGAVVVYVQTIQPELSRRRAERKVTVDATPKARSQSAARGNVHIIQPEPAAGRGRYDSEPGQAGGTQIPEQSAGGNQAAVDDAGARIINEALGITL